MAGWWKTIVANTAAANSYTSPYGSGGAYARRVANKFVAQNLTGFNWEQKVGGHIHFGTTGSYGRRLVNFASTQFPTPYGTAGSYGRQIARQNLLV